MDIARWIYKRSSCFSPDQFAECCGFIFNLKLRVLFSSHISFYLLFIAQRVFMSLRDAVNSFDQLT